MKTFEIAAHFGATTETVEVSDPWDLGITFTVRRDGYPPWRRWKSRWDSTAPVNEYVARGLVSAAAAKVGASNGNGDFSLTERGQDRQETLAAAIAEHLVVAWSGVREIDTETRKITNVAFSAKKCTELLQDKARCPGPLPLGATLCSTILKAAEAQEQAHSEAMGELEGNSESGSDGETDSVGAHSTAAPS